MNEDNFITKTAIPGLLVIKRPTFKDERGFFREAFRLNDLEKEIGGEFKIVQWNHSYSLPGVIRALHAENWNKLVYPLTGKMFAAIVDIRPDSPAFSKIETFEFSEDDPKALFIPKGLANSICVSGNSPVHYLYLVDAYYTGSDTRAVAWDDPDLNIKWPVEKPIVSERDKGNPTLRELFPEKFKK
ncbi:MAG TPA: dTDP-4-dehydrorhamnose 3,5-epimerase family protein [Patescibacteria group bacterium]|nr:dTDP-4-dehydrorhamnose 3,5-epimerase family protein [Patescibacteria group bacterium]